MKEIVCWINFLRIPFYVPRMPKGDLHEASSKVSGSYIIVRNEYCYINCRFPVFLPGYYPVTYKCESNLSWHETIEKIYHNDKGNMRWKLCVSVNCFQSTAST